jgi:hypothetical protein
MSSWIPRAAASDCTEFLNNSLKGSSVSVSVNIILVLELMDFGAQPAADMIMPKIIKDCNINTYSMILGRKDIFRPDTRLSTSA